MSSNVSNSSTVPASPESNDRAGDTAPRLSPAEREFLESSLALNVRKGFDCPKCGQPCFTGELACPKCGAQLLDGGKTRRIEGESKHPTVKGRWSVGEVFTERQKPLVFDIDGRTVVLPDQNVIVIGRLSQVSSGAEPDVNLNAFNADEFGVSRQHIRITRSKDMVYVADLGSSNGTYLNGRLLLPRMNRLLRNGDELRLGRLRLHVRF